MDEIANSDMSEFWNGRGGHKWVHNQNRIDKSLAKFGRKAMSAAPIAMNNSVLDIGCGCGDTSFEIASRVGSLGHVQGIDISKTVLDYAQQKKHSNAHKNIKFECADVQTHDFKPNEFQVAFSRFGVMFFDDPVKAFSNIRKAITPDGMLAFICWQPVNVNQWVNLPLEVVSNYVALPPAQDSNDPGAFSLGDRKRVIYVLDSAGYSKTSIQQLHTSLNVGANLEEAVTFLTQIGPSSSIVESTDIGDDTRSRIKEDLRDALVPYITEQGVELGAATWIVTASNNN